MKNVYIDFMSYVKKLTYLRITKKRPVPKLRNDKWLSDLCFLIEIARKLQLNILLQGKTNLIIDVFNHIKAHQKKSL